MNIDHKHDEKRKKKFNEFLEKIEGYHWLPQYPSFEHKHWGTKSFLDGVIISGNIAVMEIKNITELEVDGNRSDHHPVLYTLRINTKIKKVKKKEKKEDKRFMHKERPNWENTNIEKYQILSDAVLESIEEGIDENLPWALKVKLLLALSIQSLKKTMMIVKTSELQITQTLHSKILWI